MSAQTIEREVKKFFTEDAPTHLYYHTYEHCLDVRDACMRIAEFEGLDQDQRRLLEIAALLHDIGYTVSHIDHEARSVNMGREILERLEYREEDIKIICDLIYATRFPHAPNTYLEKIICDADLDYLGRGDYYPNAAKFRLELEGQGLVMDEGEWAEFQIKFLKLHQYYTLYAKQFREENKQQVLNALETSNHE